MNPAQLRKLWAEWKDYLATVKRDGGHIADDRAARMAITRKALGRERSWRENWTQKEIDVVLALIWALAQPGNLTLQLRQLDQPLTRSEGSLVAKVYLDALGIEATGREAYLNGICRRIHKCPLCDIHDAQWRDILAALNHTRMHKLGIWHSHPSRGASARPAPRKAAPRPVHTTTSATSRGDPF